MRSRLLYYMVVGLLLCGCSFSGLVLEAESSSESNVDATLICSFLSGSQLTVQASMLVNRINVFDTVYTRQAIEEMATTNPYVMGAIMLRLHESVRTQVESAFVDATVDTVTTTPTYETPLFIDSFRVNLTPASFRYNGSLNLPVFLNGVLDMGATVTYYFDLHAERGWNTTFVYTLPSTMSLVYANTADTNPDTNTVRWVVRNWDGTADGIEATISMQSKNPTTATSETEDIALELVLDTRTVTNVNFMNSILVKKVDIRPYNVLPEFVTGVKSIPADGVRLFVDNGLLTWMDFFDKTLLPIEQHTTDIIEGSSFQQNLSLSFSWDAATTVNCSTPYNVTQMDDTPAIRADFQDPEIALTFHQMPARAFFGLINAGANVSLSAKDLNFGEGLDGIGYPYRILLRLPTNITLDGETDYIWNGTTPISGRFSSERQPNPPYTAEHIETHIEIELVKMDLDIPSVFTGKNHLTTSVKMKEDDHLYVIQRPDTLPFSSKINLSYLNSDAFRLCVEETVFDEGQMLAFLAGKTAMFQQRLSNVFQGLNVKGSIDRNKFTNSLVWDGDISAMDEVIPVVVSNYANEVHMIKFNMSLWPTELSVAPQLYTLQGIENQTVTYRIIFPRGITVNATENTGRPLISGKTNDGRDYVELTFDEAAAAQSTVLTCVLNVSPVYVLGLFLPCILVFLLLVVLIVILYFIRKKKGGFRRGKKKLFEPEDTEPSEYSEQEYYVPPPPSSTRKKR
jgi:hypothetical protein